jgi:integrase
LPSGAWRAEAYAGVDPLTGKRRRIRTTAKTKWAAEIELTKLLSQVDEGRQPRSDISVRQVVEMWLDVVELEDTTRQRYEGLVRRYVQPMFGSMAAAKLDAELLDAVLRAASPL